MALRRSAARQGAGSYFEACVAKHLRETQATAERRAELWQRVPFDRRHHRQLVLAAVLEADRAALGVYVFPGCRGEPDHEGPGECVACKVVETRGGKPEIGKTLDDGDLEWLVGNQPRIDDWAFRATLAKMNRLQEWRLIDHQDMPPVPADSPRLRAWYDGQRYEQRSGFGTGRWSLDKIDLFVARCSVGKPGRDFALFVQEGAPPQATPFEPWVIPETGHPPLAEPVQPEPTDLKFSSGELVGRIVPWDRSITLGPGWEERFAPASLHVPPGKPIPVTWEHREDQPIGEVVEWLDEPDGMHVRCRLDDSAEAEAVERLVTDGLVSGFSVSALSVRGSEHYDNDMQTLTTVHRTAMVRHLAVTAVPAYGDYARITTGAGT